MLILTAFVLALLPASPDLSVRNNLSLDGIVTDPSSALIPRVLVLIKTGDTLDWTFTNEVGRYRFASLKPGQYELILTMSGFVTRKRLVNLTTPMTQDEILELLPIETCACVSVPPPPDVLKTAADRLRQVALRMEDLQPAADLDVRRREVINDFRAFGPCAIPALKDALDAGDTQVRVNGTVLLFGLLASGADLKTVYLSDLILSLARASIDTDPTLRRYALVTLNRALQELK